MTKSPEKLEVRSEKLGRLWWLTDTPLFIDDALNRRLHDAIIAPELESEDVERKAQTEVRSLLEGSASLKATSKITAPGILEAWFPSLNAEAAGVAVAKLENQSAELEAVRGRRVRTSERMLQEIAFKYLSEYADRILFVDMDAGTYSNLKGQVDAEQVEELLRSPPRPLVFLDLPRDSVVFPTVVELEAGGFRRIYETLEREFLDVSSNIRYPSDTDPEAPDKRKIYWDALKKSFKSRKAMEHFERAVESDRIGWVDFRLLFDSGSGESAHLHIVPAGKYHGGVFGYNFIHRAHRYGARVVGTLKAGNDINVLAIYEK